MTRFKPYSRRALSRRRRDWARRNATLLLLATGGLAGVLALLTALLVWTWPGTSSRWYLIGFLHAALIATAAHLFETAFFAHDREAMSHVRGAWGEENTTSELKSARRKRLIWGWVDSISLQAGDLDHLVVTRHGGLVAIDSKFRNQANDTIDMAAAAKKARLRAEALANTLLKADKGARHRAKINPLSVTPIVVVWGAAQADIPTPVRVDGIEFVAGRGLIDWLARLEGQPVSKAAANDVVKRLEEYRSTAWASTLKRVVALTAVTHHHQPKRARSDDEIRAVP
jgi:hypothetical protein